MKRWPKTGLSTHFLWFPIPASASVPTLLFLLHMRLWTLGLALLVCVALIILKSKGRTATWVFRRFRNRLGGDVIQARPIWYRRRMHRPNSFDLIDLDDLKNDPK
jgi:hypothetical protein